MAYSQMGTILWAGGGKKIEKNIYIYTYTYIALCFTVEGIHNKLKENVGHEVETRFLSGLHRKVLASTRLKPSKDHSFPRYSPNQTPNPQPYTLKRKPKP